MKNKIFTSFYTSTLNGIESIKKSLILFDDVIIPAPKNAIEKQIDIFSDNHSDVKRYLNKHLFSLVEINHTFSSYVTELLTYFGKYHFENWLNPTFEEEVGEFIDQTQAEISWHQSLKLDSVLLSQFVTNKLKVPTYIESAEFLFLKDPPDNLASVISDSSFYDMFDYVVPDPSNLDWLELIYLLNDNRFIAFREKLRLCIENKVPISQRYLEDLIQFFEKQFPEKLDMAVALKGIDTAIGSLIPIYGPGKALHDIYKIDKTFKRYSWVSLVHDIKKQIQKFEEEEDSG